MALQVYDQQAALGFLISQVSNIEAEVYRIQYPSIQYRDLVPVLTEGNEWARSTTFFSMDVVGRAEWFDHLATDMPMADVVRNIHEHGYHMAGIGYRYTLEELGVAMMVPGNNLSTDRAEAARLAAEQTLDDLALRGDTRKNMFGLFNNPTVTAVLAADTGTGSSRLWSQKSPENIVADVNGAFQGVFTSSLTVEMADTLLLPYEHYLRLATTTLPQQSITLLEFLARASVSAATSGRPPLIRGVRGLETAGAGGTARMVAYRRDPSVVRFHMPMPHRFLPVWQTGPMIFDVPGIFRTGGTEIRRPGAFRYIDGI